MDEHIPIVIPKEARVFIAYELLKHGCYKAAQMQLADYLGLELIQFSHQGRSLGGLEFPKDISDSDRYRMLEEAMRIVESMKQKTP